MKVNTNIKFFVINVKTNKFEEVPHTFYPTKMSDADGELQCQDSTEECHQNLKKKKKNKDTVNINKK